MSRFQSDLAGMMANPYILGAAFILTLFGAWSGIRSFLSYFSSLGEKSFDYAFKMMAQRPLEEGVKMAARADGKLGYLIGQYMEILMNFIVQSTLFILQVFMAMHFLNNFSGEIDINLFLFFSMILFSFSSFFKMMTLRIKLFAVKNAIPLIEAMTEMPEAK